MNSLQRFLERTTFGVCSYISEKLGVQSSRVRLYFIYASFLTFGSPLIIYLVMAFWLNIKKYIRRDRDMLWE